MSRILARGFDAEVEIDSVNQALKGLRVKLRLEKMNDKLYLRGVFPPKPGTGRIKPFTQRLATGLSAHHLVSIKKAAKLAQKVYEEIVAGTFSWKEWNGTSPRETVADWVAAFEQDYFSKTERNPASETTWAKNYLTYFRRLPQEERLTPELLLKAIDKTDPDSAFRKRMCGSFANLAKFAGLSSCDFSSFAGSYTQKAVNPRDLPTDEEIYSVYSTIEHLKWRAVYGLLAVYGLRNHEVMLCDRSELQTTGILHVLDGKTGPRKVWPWPEEWLKEWKLWELPLPQISIVNEDGSKRKHSLIGNSVYSGLMKVSKLPFAPYNLRHAWALRVTVGGLPDAIAAKMMGHTTSVHQQVYCEFTRDDHFQKAWEQMKARNSLSNLNRHD